MVEGTVLVKYKRQPLNGTARIPEDAFDEELHELVDEEPVE